MDSRIPATIDALVAAWTAALVPVPVWDGPVVSGDFSDAVFVGYDGNPEGAFDAVAGTQEWAGLGARARTEEFDVVCSIVVLAGDGALGAARQRVFSLLASAAAALRANPGLGQAPPFVAEVASPALFTEPTSQGLQARLSFAVHVRTRI